VSVPENQYFVFYIILQPHTDISGLRNIGQTSFGFREEKLYSTFFTCTVHSFVVTVIKKFVSKNCESHLYAILSTFTLSFQLKLQTFFNPHLIFVHSLLVLHPLRWPTEFYTRVVQRVKLYLLLL